MTTTKQLAPGPNQYFDTEGNGLLPELHSMWCLGIIDMDTDEEFYYGPAVPMDYPWDIPDHPAPSEEIRRLLANPSGGVEDGVKALATADLSVAHNGIGYDYPAVEMLYPKFIRPRRAWDSLIAAKVVWPYDSLVGPDLARIKNGTMPPQMLKRHSLKAWGYRLGEYKGEYKLGFDKWRPEMASYMMQDCRPGVKLWRLIRKRIGWDEPEKADLVWPELTMEVEHAVARHLHEQQEDGVNFDRAKAIAMAAELANTKAALEHELVETFGSWWALGPHKVQGATVNRKRTEFPDVVTPRVGAKGNALKPSTGSPVEVYTEGSTFAPVVHTEFSPASRDHLGQRLQAQFGWKPKKFGKDGKPSVDETTLEEIPESVMPAHTRQLILDFFVVNKTLGTLTQGRKSWLAMCGDDGRIHGEMDGAGAITGRGTHKNPNLSGTPSVLKEKVVLPDGTKTEVVVKGLRGRYGWECRELFIADDGWELTGVDASSLELIDLGHYLWPTDDGAFSSRVCDPARDPHQEHADIADMTRADAKTTIYLKIFGGSAYKLSLDITITPEEVPEYLGYRGLPMLLRSVEMRFGPEFVAKLDDTQKARIAKARTIIIKLEAGIVGLKDLMELVKSAAGRGWLKGLDGRRLVVRKPHAALNTLLQSAGAQTCKLWMMLVHMELNRLGYKRGVDFKQVLWVHDELQFTHRPGLGPVISEVAKRCIKEAGIILNLRGEYRGDAKTGRNWAECH